MKKIRIATRASKLALWQAEWVASEIMKKHPGADATLVKIKTTGDKILDVPLAMVGGKGLFTKEIEEALLNKDAELAVHSLKDVPTIFPNGLHLAAVPKREDPRDALISRAGVPFKDLPKGAKIGTSSLRRKAQLLSMRPDFKIEDLRGNIDTRLRKVKEGVYDAIILAGAGLKRLGWANEITEYLDPEVMLPAIGQGALGIETRTDDKATNALVSFFNDPATETAVRAERALLRRLEGGCQVPIAAHGAISGKTLRLTGLVASIDGTKIIKDMIEGPTADAERMGVELAERLLTKGALAILSELYEVAPPA